MDSLMAVELRLALEARLRIDLPLMSLAEGTSVASIASRLASSLVAPQSSEIVTLAERYEIADVGVLEGSDSPDPQGAPTSIESAAAE
jgi:hypothetical protein